MALHKTLRLILVWALVACVFVGNHQANAQSEDIDAYLGQISSDEFNEGDKITFSGSIFNLGNGTLIVYAMNATFIEILGEASVRDPERYDFSKGYQTSGFIVGENQIYSDNFEAKIDLNPGQYNVSIGFAWFNGTATSPDVWNYNYALSNQTVQIFGTSEGVDFARGIGIFLAVVIVAIILYWVYTKLR